MVGSEPTSGPVGAGKAVAEIIGAEAIDLISVFVLCCSRNKDSFMAATIFLYANVIYDLSVVGLAAIDNDLNDRIIFVLGMSLASAKLIWQMAMLPILKSDHESELQA